NNSFPFQHIATKIDQQADAKFGGSQIVQHLFDVRVGQLFDGLRFKENSTTGNEARVVIVRQDNSFIRDFVISLTQKGNSSASQFNNESVLVDDFVVPLSQLTRDLHAKTHQLKKPLPCKAAQT